MNTHDTIVEKPNYWIEQGQLLLIAIGFFTRIPIPEGIAFSTQRLNHANRYFGLVGLLVGVFSAGIYVISSWLFPIPVAILLSMAASVFITGAFHEDGLADVFDGFGGGMTVEKKLTIMKDSRLGTYGTAALMLSLLLKLIVLWQLANIAIWLPVIALITMHTLSRISAVSLMYNYSYVRLEDVNKSRSVATQQSRGDLTILLLTGLLVLLWLPITVALALFLTAFIGRQLCGYWFAKQLGGYTGDCLGAAQQLIELLGYLVLLSIIQHGWF